MSTTEILVKSALASILNVSDSSIIKLNYHLRNDLKLDSMGSLMFLMKLEDTVEGFIVDPETLEASDLETVSSVINYINSQRYRDTLLH